MSSHYRWITIILSSVLVGCALSVPSERQREETRHAVSLQAEAKDAPLRTSVLLSDRVSAIAAGQEDVWIATDKGCNHLDRHKSAWVSYTVENGLANNTISCVAIDSDAVWFGTKSGVSRYDMGQDKWSIYTRDDGLPSNRILAVAVDGNYVWFGTEKGLSRYNKELDSWALRTTDDGGLTSNRISCIAVEDEYVWFATDRGISRYDKDIDSWTKLTRKDGLSEDNVTAIAIDEDFIWFGTRNSGVSLYSKAEQTFIKSYTRRDFLKSDKINCILIDGSYVWIGTANAGAQRYIKPVDTWIQYTTEDGLPSMNITAMAVRDRYVWFGTHEGGFARLDKMETIWASYTKAQGLPCDNVKSIAEKDGVLWIGTYMGLSRFDLETGHWETHTKARGLTTNYITCVLVDEDAVWVGTSKGLGRYQDGRWKFWRLKHGLCHDFVLAAAVVDDAVWVGTRGGLCRYDKANGTWTALTDLKDICVNAVAAGNDCIWVGTSQGLFRLDPEELDSVRYTVNDGLAGDHVNTIAIAEDAVWIGTQNGLSRFHKNRGSWQSFTTENGLPNNNVRAISRHKTQDTRRKTGLESGVLSLESLIWIGTAKGLAKYSETSGRWQGFDLADPGTDMGHENVRDICILNNQVWLATAGGLGVFSVEDNSWRAIRSEERENVLRQGSIYRTELDGNSVWFSAWNGNSNGEIVRCDKRTGTWTQYTKEDVIGSGQDRKAVGEAPYITRIYWMEVTDDKVWFATDGGVLAYSKDSDTWRHYTTTDGLADNRTITLMVDGSDVWIGLRDKRVCRYQQDADKWDTYQIILKENVMGSSGQRLAADSRYVWIPAGYEGLMRYDKDADSWKRYTSTDGLSAEDTRSVVIDDGRLWAYGYGGGLSKYDEKTDSWVMIDQRVGLAANMVRELISGRDYMWVLYYAWYWYDQGGLPSASGFHRENQSWQIFHGNPESVGNDFTDVQETEDCVWFSTDGHGITRYDKASSSWTVFTVEDGLLNNGIRNSTLKVDGEHLWACSFRGISRYDVSKNVWTAYTGRRALRSDNVMAVLADSRYVYCGADSSAIRYDKQNDVWEDIGGGRGQVNTLAADEKYLWIATSEGVRRHDKAARVDDRYDEKNRLPSKFVKAAGIQGNCLWIGTDKGICKYNTLSDDPNAWETFTSALDVDTMHVSEEYAVSLVDNNITSIAADPRYVWVGTEKGVSRYDTKRGLWATYTQQDGLLTDEISSICIDNHLIWFGTKKGINRLDTSTGEWESFTKADGLPSNNITCVVAKDDHVWFGTFDAGVILYDKVESTWRNFTTSDGLSHNRISAIASDDDFVWFGTEIGLSRYDTITDTWTIFTRNFDEEDR